MHRALFEAIRLGHSSAGPPHLLLALLDERHPSVAQEVLHSLAVRRDGIEEVALRHYRYCPIDPGDQRAATSDLLWHEASGRAEAFAAVLGDGAVKPEHVLLALVWQPQLRWFHEVLASVGTTREAVIAGLAERGVPVPAIAPPALPPPKTQAAEFPRARLQDLNWALRQRVPDLNWGIGTDPHDDAVAVVLAAAHVDLSSILDDVVGQGGWKWLRRDPPSSSRCSTDPTRW